MIYNKSGLEKITISPWLVTLLHISRVIPTPQSSILPETLPQYCQKLCSIADIATPSAACHCSACHCIACHCIACHCVATCVSLHVIALHVITLHVIASNFHRQQTFFFFTVLRGLYRQVIRGSSFFLMSFKNRYGIGNNVWKFQVSTIKIVPVARIWSLGVTRIIMSQGHDKGA